MHLKLTLEQSRLKSEVEAYLEFEQMHYEVTQTQLERDLLTLYALHEMLVPEHKVRMLAEGLEAHRQWQKETHEPGDSEDERQWWREGEQAGTALPDPDPSTHCTSRTLWPGG